ncbi:MFS general substrate transporter, partial [Aureobasidium melanogenum]
MPENKHTTITETRAEEPVVQPAIEQVSEPYEDAQGVDLEKGNQKNPNLDLVHIQSHASAHDIPHIPYRESGDEVYDKFTHTKKICVVSVLAFCSFLAPMASTTILAAVPEVAATYNTTGTLINASNALYMLFMGLSPMFWGPIGQVYGRRWTQLLSAIFFAGFSVGTALAPNLASFFIFRILTAFQGTSFLIIGSSCIGDIYRPTERATALSWFFSGTLIGPALGPLLGGIIVTYKSWRDIFWLQTGLAVFATVLCCFFLPETIHYKKSVELEGLKKSEQAKKLWSWTNPLRVIRLYRYPNLLFVGLASSSLVFNMYSLLTPIRYVINPRFHLTSPIQSGLFYIAPGCGYLFGTFFGGRWADRTVRKWIDKRNGERVPEDRLRSCLVFMGIIIPGCILIYGWSIEKDKGGIPLPVIVMFIQGVAQLFCFPSLNTYCLDVMQKRSSEVVAGNYMLRYIFAATGTAACLPAVEAIGVGWFSTISAGFLCTSAVLTWTVTIWGREWREAILLKKEERQSEKQENRGST